MRIAAPCGSEHQLLHAGVVALEHIECQPRDWPGQRIANTAEYRVNLIGGAALGQDARSVSLVAVQVRARLFNLRAQRSI